MNLLTSNLQCIECGCTELIKDYSRREIFCSKCGLVLVDTSLPGLNDIVNELIHDDNRLKTLSDNARKLGNPHVLDDIIEEIEKL